MKVKQWLHEHRLMVLYYIFRVFPIKKNKIVFCNYVGKGYGCNPKYIAEELIARHQNWEIVWMTKEKDSVFPNEIRAVKWESVRAIYDLTTAAVWVDNQRKLPYNKKRAKQFFVETWHGGAIPFKKIGADNPNNFHNEPYRATSKHMDKIVNLMVSNGPLRTEVYRRAFLYQGEVLECGTPRDDILVKGWKNIKKKVYSKFSLSLDTKTVLYAPTYRNGRSLEPYTLDAKLLLHELQEKFGGEWILLLRLHPTMKHKAKELVYDAQVRNASDYEDTQELLASCDILISDYSAVVSEFVLTKKPVFLYAADLDEYLQERNFYLNYLELPFSISKNNAELKENIHQFQEDEYEKKVTEYFSQLDFCENGTASASVVDRIIEWNSKI